MAEKELTPPFARIHEEAFAVERVHFKKTKKRTSQKKADPFLALEGTLPVLVAAPHSVRQVRQGKVRPSAEFTGSLAFLLHRETGCHTLAVKKLYGGDPEWDNPCPFKARLGEIVGARGIRATLVLHGLPPEQESDVSLEAVHGPQLRVSRRIAEMLRAELHAEGISRITEAVAPVEGQDTVSRHCAAVLGTPAVRIGIDHRFRAPNRNGTDYQRLFRSLARAIPKLDGSG